MKILILLLALLGGSYFITDAFGDALPPILQMKAGIPPADVVCNQDLVKMINPANKVVCVKSSTSDMFANRGWEKAPDAEPSVADVQNSVRTISVTSVEAVGVKKSSTSLHDHIFEVCAGSVTFVSPEVIIKSDIATKSVTLANDIPANSCLTTTAQILAIDPKSITITLTKQDEIITRISSLKANVENLILQLEEERRNFSTLLTLAPGADKDDKVSASTANLISLRQSISEIKDDLNRYYFVLYANTPSPKAAKPAAEMGAGNSVSILSTAPSRSGQMHDVVLRVCAGERTITNPMVDLSSDTKRQTLKLTTLVNGACYTTGAKIEAASADSITATFNESVVNTTSLEDTIKSLEQQLARKRAELITLTENTVNPDPAMIRQVSGEMSSIRESLVTAKAAYYQSLYQAYK